MRSLPLAILGGTLLVLAASPALAGGFSVGVTGGASVPTSDFGNAAETGYVLGATVDKGMGPMWGLGLDAAYHVFKEKAGTSIFDVKTTAAQYGAHLRVTPPMVGPIHPYAQVGAAAYNLKAVPGTVAPGFTEISTSKFGWNAGAGVEFAFMPTLSLGITGLYHNVSAKDELGADLGWFSTQGMMTFHVPVAK
jgi:opacity protein-like surface antigen